MSGEVIPMALRLSSIIPVLAALAGGCSPSFEASLPDVEITQHGLVMAGAPGLPQPGGATVTSSFTISSSIAAWAKRMNSKVFVHQVTVTASGGLPNLDFIESALVTATAPSISESTTEIANYARSVGAQSSSSIEGTRPAPIDVTRLWSADQMVISLQATGQLPEQDWIVDVTLKFSGDITYDF